MSKEKNLGFYVSRDVDSAQDLIGALEAENTALKSRVAELEACMMPMMIGSCTCCTKTPVKHYHQDTCRYKVVGDVLDRKPAASLLLHDADLLEEYAKALPEVASSCSVVDDYCMDAMDCAEWIIQEAKALRKQAEKL